MGWETLDVGEKFFQILATDLDVAYFRPALVYTKDGSARIEEGPKRMYLFSEKLVHMDRYSASQKQYLRIRYKTGNIEHRKGPCFEHLNIINHVDISVRDLISLDANEALVVYSKDVLIKNVARSIQYGPTLFMLGENEWLHEFSWHGTDPDNKTRMVQDINKSTRLKIIPDQFYYNVDEVRTKDDALMRVKLMLFYELIDIEKMLKSTIDPMADFINCLCADVIAFAAKFTYEEFIEIASELNQSKNYPLLMDRCEQIGFRISKVIFRGYFAHDKLQSMHDLMIKKRTGLKLEYEKEVQKQEMTDLKLQADVDRMKQEQEMEVKNLIHKQKMEIDALQHQLKLEKESHEKSLSKDKQVKEAKLNAKIAVDELETKHLSNLHKLDVDITDLMETRSSKPKKITNIIASEKAAHIYLHHNDQPYRFPSQ